MNTWKLMTLQNRLHVLEQLGTYLNSPFDDGLNETIAQAVFHNQWFTAETIRFSLSGIANSFLRPDTLRAFVNKYSLDQLSRPKNVGLVLAGNLPLVGWHDFMCVFIVGYKSFIKPSEKDTLLLTFLLQKMVEIDPRCASYFEFIERMPAVDAIIATGSNNASRYFEAYFGKYPHIIRKNRNSIAILHNSDDDAVLMKLAVDIFQYFGLGCRSVSKIYLPKDFEVLRFLRLYDDYENYRNHVKYRNNFDYNLSLFLLNREPFLNNSTIIFKEDSRIASRIATVHYEFYTDLTELTKQLLDQKEELQCIVSSQAIDSLKNIVKPGDTQYPAIDDYADGVDTMRFLIEIP